MSASEAHPPAGRSPVAAFVNVAFPPLGLVFAMGLLWGVALHPVDFGWADAVAGELSRVTWPTRDIVLNGTLVVVVASAIATVYVTILDRFWSFLTNLVYGA